MVPYQNKNKWYREIDLGSRWTRLVIIWNGRRVYMDDDKLIKNENM